MLGASSVWCWSSLSHRWAREAVSRLAGRARSFRRQSRTVRQIRPSHHRRGTHRRTVRDNCRQNTGLRSTIRQSLRIECLRSLLGLPNGRSDRSLLVRLRIAPGLTGESHRPCYLRMHDVPVAASASPVDESSSFELSDQLPQFPGHGVATCFSVKAIATALPGQPPKWAGVRKTAPADNRVKPPRSRTRRASRAPNRSDGSTGVGVTERVQRLVPKICRKPVENRSQGLTRFLPSLLAAGAPRNPAMVCALPLTVRVLLPVPWCAGRGLPEPGRGLERICYLSTGGIITA